MHFDNVKSERNKKVELNYINYLRYLVDYEIVFMVAARAFALNKEKRLLL